MRHARKRERLFIIESFWVLIITTTASISPLCVSGPCKKRKIRKVRHPQPVRSDNPEYIYASLFFFSCVLFAKHRNHRSVVAALPTLLWVCAGTVSIDHTLLYVVRPSRATIMIPDVGVLYGFGAAVLVLWLAHQAVVFP